MTDMRDLIERLNTRYRLGAPTFRRDDLVFIDVLDHNELRALLTCLRDKESFTHLVLLTAVDWIEEGRFQLTYMLNDRVGNRTLALRVYLDRTDPVEFISIHDLWPTAATYQRELREMFGIGFPGSPRVNEEFILEGWTDMPPYRRDFDTLAYSQQTYRDRPGRETRDPRDHMKQKLYPEG